MKLALTVALVPAALAFTPSAPAFVRSKTSLAIGSDRNVDLSGNTWKPDSEKMGATDTGDYFPEGYDPKQQQIDYMEGIGGSSATLGSSNRGGPQLPGMENLGADAVIQGGIELDSDIPAGMEFIPSSVPDGEYEMNAAATGKPTELTIAVKPVCMTFEDYYAAFAADSHPSFSVKPAIGRMDRRGGELTELTIVCDPRGASGLLQGDLVVNLPEDNSKICFKIKANSF